MPASAATPISALTLLRNGIAATRPAKVAGAAKALGVNFLRLAKGSDLIDKGEDVGLPFAGSAPDLGPFETGLVEQDGGTAGGE